MSNLGCCLWWFVAGLLVGWLLWHGFDRFFRRDGDAAAQRIGRLLDDERAVSSGLQRANHALRARIDQLLAARDEARREPAPTSDAPVTRAPAVVAPAAIAPAVAAPITRVLAITSPASITPPAAPPVERSVSPPRPPVERPISPPRPPAPRGADDLLVIEGIGPKINELLIAAGIDSFTLLRTTPVERLRAILEDGGPNFRLANPVTWARQAELCEQGDWEGLRRYQDQLTGGISRDKPRN